MTHAARMLTRMVLVRFVAILICVALFVVLLEVVSYSREIQELRPGDFSIIPEYMLMRLPVVMSTFLPISILLAVLLALTELAYRNEIVALWTAGVSPPRLLLMLLPLAIATGAFHFLLGDYVIPKVAPQLHQWGVGDYGKSARRNGSTPEIWMRAGRDILRIEKANANSTVLRNVTIFRRGANGNLSEQIFATRAVRQRGAWTLRDADIYRADGSPPRHLAVLAYRGNMTPAAAGKRTGEPEEMSLRDLGYFAKNRGFGLRPVWAYETWWHKRTTLFVTALVMIALCVPLASRFRRGGGLGGFFVVGIGLGFLYFVADGLTVTMGELGFVTPWFAAWFPAIGFLALAASLSLHAEKA